MWQAKPFPGRVNYPHYPDLDEFGERESGEGGGPSFCIAPHSDQSGRRTALDHYWQLFTSCVRGGGGGGGG